MQGKPTHKKELRLMALGAFLLFSLPAHAEGSDSNYIITLKDHQFSPKELTIPADQKIKLTVKNAEPTPVEFESSDMNREKVVAPNSEVTVFIGPLETGSYAYFDDFHRETTGTIVAK